MDRVPGLKTRKQILNQSEGLPARLSYPLRVWGWGWAGAGNSSAELVVVAAAQKENVVLSPHESRTKTLENKSQTA